MDGQVFGEGDSTRKEETMITRRECFAVRKGGEWCRAVGKGGEGVVKGMVSKAWKGIK